MSNEDINMNSIKKKKKGIKFVVKQKKPDSKKKIKFIVKSPKKEKKDNESNSKKLENKIVEDINNNTVFGTIIKNSFFKKFGKNISKAKKIGEKKHHDILLFLDDNTKCKCEVKSSKSKHPDCWNTPWEFAGQFLNGTGDNWRIRKIYGEEWYKKLSEIKEKYKLESEIPSFNIWWKKDANMGSVKTDFGKEFKNKVSRKERSIIKSEFVKNLKVSEDNVRDLLEDYLRESKLVLNDKDCWLVISEKHNAIKFFDKVEPENIEYLERNYESKDLVYKIKSDKFNEIRIRWQNDNCIANISVQCK